MRKRTLLRGVLFGAASHVLLALASALVGAKLASLVSSAARVANPLETGPFEPLSVGWWIQQPVVFAIGFGAGVVAAHYSSARSWKAPAILALGWFALSSLALPASQNLFALAAWLLLSPLGVLMGAFVYMRRLERNDA